MNTTEHTYTTEATAKAARRAHIDAGATVSLIGYDSTRNVYAYDVLSHAKTDQIAKIKRIAKQIWDERHNDITIEGDLAWYLDEYTEYDLLTRAEYDAVYDELVELFNESK